MANNDGIHRIKDVLKKQIGFAFRIYLSIAIILSPLYLMSAANAAGLGGWSLGGGVSQGASVIYNGSKEVILNGAKKLATGTAKITPAAADVAKLLGKGVGGLALSVAVEQLIGAVDWVLDPENNSIKYHVSEPETGQYIIVPASGYGVFYNAEDCLQSLAAGGTIQNIQFLYGFAYYGDVYRNGQKSNTVQCNQNANPAYDPSAVGEEKSIPLNTVAQQIISNAATGNADAQTVVRAAADTIVAEAETDSTKARPIINQLEASQSIPTDQTATGETVPKEETGENTGTDTKGSDISLDFPIFCDWAPSVCQAANVVIQKPDEWAENIKAAYDDAVDYFKEEPTDSEPEELEIEQAEFEADEVDLQGSTACPQDQVSFSLMGNSYTLDMPYQPVCNALEFFRPAVLTVGAITSAFIVAGIRTKEDEE
ncbi:virulence factor TspB C-terminal domain-related protein [Acinetobacter ursingii]|uniref:virulence factor TspB C-terminal domain-related protein n=1 Tax=Acinetobacter ursingii TaxID=108980 RepID=UPI0012502072|nr:virulence factor TspB C-terminal domain-related protein [Acinetobacter ursingii]